MENTVIEAQARYLIEDRTHPTHREHLPSGVRRRQRKPRRLGWL